MKREEESLENIRQFVMHTPTEDDKMRALENIYSTLPVGQAVIFCQTKMSAVKITRSMKVGVDLFTYLVRPLEYKLGFFFLSYNTILLQAPLLHPSKEID